MRPEAGSGATSARLVRSPGPEPCGSYGRPCSPRSAARPCVRPAAGMRPRSYWPPRPLLGADGLLVEPTLKIDEAVSDVSADLDVLRSTSEVSPLRQGAGRDLQCVGHFFWGE